MQYRYRPVQSTGGPFTFDTQAGGLAGWLAENRAQASLPVFPVFLSVTLAGPEALILQSKAKPLFSSLAYERRTYGLRAQAPLATFKGQACRETDAPWSAFRSSHACAQINELLPRALMNRDRIFFCVLPSLTSDSVSDCFGQEKRTNSHPCVGTVLPRVRFSLVHLNLFVGCVCVSRSEVNKWDVGNDR